MVCPSCGVEVAERQHFCAECGASLHGVTEPTEPLDMVDAGGLLPQLKRRFTALKESP